MDRNTVFRRTTAGQDEIKTRQRGLEHNHRFALIMIDGVSNVAQLAAKSAGRWDTEALLRDLWDRGLIEPLTASPAEAASATSEATVQVEPPKNTTTEDTAGLPETTNSAPGPETTASGSASAEAIKELLGENIKDELIAVVRAIMGESGGEKLIAKIQASEETPTALADAVDSGCIFIKLTVSESKAAALKERLHEMLADKYDRSFFKDFFKRK